MTATQTAELPVLASHNAPVRAIAFSPDASHIATADVDGMLHMRRGGELLWEWKFKFFLGWLRPRMYVRALAFAPDGKTLYVAVGDTLRGYEVDSGREIFRYRSGPTFGFLKTSPLDIAVSPEAAVAVAYDDTTVEVWTPNGSRVRQTSAWKDNDAPNMLAFLGSDRIVGSDHISVCVWDADMGTKIAKHVPGIRVHALAAAGSIIATRSLYDVTLWSHDGEKIGSVEIGSGLPTLALSIDGQRMAAGDAHGASVFDRQGAQVGRYDSSAATIALAFIPGSSEVAIARSDGSVVRWPL